MTDAERAALLAACVDIEQTTSQLTSWWTEETS